VYPQSRLRFVTGLALIIAVAAAAFAAEGLTQDSRSRSRIAVLQAELTTLQQRMGADEHGAAGERLHMRRVAAQAIAAQRALGRVNWELQSLPTENEVARVRNRVTAYAACIPELQSAIDHLGINWRINPVKPNADYFKLFTAAPVSRSCAIVLTGR
jgi:hypothetical protein